MPTPSFNYFQLHNIFAYDCTHTHPHTEISILHQVFVKHLEIFCLVVAESVSWENEMSVLSCIFSVKFCISKKTLLQ